MLPVKGVIALLFVLAVLAERSTSFFSPLSFVQK